MLQLNVTEQAIHTFDRMLGVSSAGIDLPRSVSVRRRPYSKALTQLIRALRRLRCRMGSAWEKALCKNRTACMSLG